MEKKRLVEFMAKVMEQSGYKVYKNFKTSKHIIDIYGVLPTVVGDIGVIVACKNYDEKWNVGLDVLKEMEMISKSMKASKAVVVTTSGYTPQAINYAARRNIKLIDREMLFNIAQRFAKEKQKVEKQKKVEKERQENHEVYDTSYEEPQIDYITGYVSPSTISSRRAKGPLGSVDRSSVLNMRKKGQPTNQVNNGPTISLNLYPMIKDLMNNTFILIAFVVLISYLITSLINWSGQLNHGMLGLLKFILSAALSYGLVYVFEERNAEVLIKGTTVFFISLLISIILIFI